MRPPPFGYYSNGYPVYQPFGPNPLAYIYSLVSYKPSVKHFVVDNVSCLKCKTITKKKDKEKMVEDQVKASFKKRYNNSDVHFEKVSDVSYDLTSKKFKITVDYTTKTFMRGILNYVTKKNRIKEIRSMVNDELK